MDRARRGIVPQAESVNARFLALDRYDAWQMLPCPALDRCRACDRGSRWKETFPSANPGRERRADRVRSVREEGLNGVAESVDREQRGISLGRIRRSMTIGFRSRARSELAFWVPFWVSCFWRMLADHEIALSSCLSPCSLFLGNRCVFLGGSRSGERRSRDAVPGCERADFSPKW